MKKWLLILMTCLFASCGKSPQMIQGTIQRADWGSYYIPSDYDDTREYPLLVLLHPMNSYPDQFILNFKWIDFAEDRDYIICAPKARITYWEDDDESPDRETVFNFIRFMNNNCNIDRKRVCLWGFSSGSHFANTLLIYNRKHFFSPRRFTSVVSASGGTGYQWDKIIRESGKTDRMKVPIYIMWGAREDPAPPAELAEYLSLNGWNPVIRIHDRGHEIPSEEIRASLDWFDALP